MSLTKCQKKSRAYPLFIAIVLAGGLLMMPAAAVYAGELSTGDSRASADGLPLDDPWVMFCLLNSDPGKDLDNCLRGVPSSVVGGNKSFTTSASEVYPNYEMLVKAIEPADDRNVIDGFTSEQPVYETVTGCGVHFASGEHPLSVRCNIENACDGAFDPDVVLSVHWDKLLWNDASNTVSHGAPENCAVALELNQIPSTPAACGQQIVDAFNQSLSCGTAGMSAYLTNAPAGSFIDIYFSSDNPTEMSMPGPASLGTLTY